MQTLSSSPTIPISESARTTALFEESQLQILQRTDRMFAWLMMFQWLAGIAAALWISPRTWIGATSQVNMHVWAAILLGGAISSLPVFLALKRPGYAFTRHTIAVAQLVTSALLIHLRAARLALHLLG